MIRLRQIAFATCDLVAGEAALTRALGVQLCHRDPNLIVFGLENALFPVGDQFFEIVTPVEDGTTAGRLLHKRGGDCGYMVLFQVDGLVPVERRLAEHGIRVVFDAAADGIRGLHLHPKDVPGAIVSIDAAREPAEWPWAGPRWRDHVDTSQVSSIGGMTVSVEDPTAACRVWAHALGISAADDRIEVDDATVRFRATEAGGRSGITHVEVTTPRPDLRGTTHDLLGVTVDIV